MFNNEIYTKVIVSGNLVQVFKYEKPIVTLTGKRGGRRFRYESPSDMRVEHKKVSNGRAKTMFKRLYACNFLDTSTFITLTFDPQKPCNFHDLAVCRKEWDNFIKRMRRRFSKFRYLGVTEFQHNGSIHYHVVTDISSISPEQLTELWQVGHSKAKVITNGPEAIERLTSYMTKEISDLRLQSSHTYLRSRNLLQPLEYHGVPADLMLEYDLHDFTPYNAQSYDTKYFGQVSIEEYYIPNKASHLGTRRGRNETVKPRCVSRCA
ncbi:hypothetical protein MKZ15_23810 [Paenibacillus sp. FSL R7-0216]|uniref:rolling circle replication-associated protein n=1 Tax=Paenibacillus sp. FSL R7-0216 TaxID=2921677 RepID=UPI0030DDB4EB